MVRGIILIICFLIMTGCATTQRSVNPDLQGMQSRIDLLEDEMKLRDEEMGNIQSQLRQVKQECMKKNDYVGVSSSTSLSLANNDESAEIIRVEGVSASQVQVALKNAGFYHGALDKKLGPKTKEAIRAFQKANNITADGVVGKKTWEKLRSNL